MFKPKNFGWADLVVLIAFECIAVPICIAAGEAFVSRHYDQAIFGWLIGIPLAVGGFTAPWWMEWLSEPVRNSIRRQTLRWWPAALLLAFLYVTGPTIFATASWTLVAIIATLVGAAIAAAAFAYMALNSPATEPPKAVETPTQNAVVDGQTHLDLLHLLDFGVNETTLWMLDRLLETADSPAVTDGLKNGPNTEEAHNARQFFIGYARQEIGTGTFRHSDYLNVMHGAEVDAELDLKSTPQAEWPSGIDPLTLRQYKISEL